MKYELELFEIDQQVFWRIVSYLRTRGVKYKIKTLPDPDLEKTVDSIA